MIEWEVITLTLQLALLTAVLTLPIGIVLGRTLALSQNRHLWWLEAFIMLPLVLPPTVMGFYYLNVFAGTTLVFSFVGILLASVLINIAFVTIPIRRAWEQIPRATIETAACCGWTPWRVFWHCELPQAWGGVVSAFVLVTAHTIGEFGVVMMVGGNLPGQTRTLAVAVYDHVQALQLPAAHSLSLIALALGLMLTLLANTFAKNSSQNNLGKSSRYRLHNMPNSASRNLLP